MKIQWHNIVAAILMVIVAVLLVRWWPEIMGTLASIKNIGPGHSTEDKTTGLIALGLVGAFLVAVVKILTHERK